ncbi:hypothetical protein ACQRIT_000603 [Beauveria bassiana]|uniref:Uncharacterized protein n=3 Tax=Beauveria TaxID=5581 RepID=A0A0A2VPG2_BEABA|nr:hypothetical protein BBAD15_g4884 [Beauveria bassiana D1-5]OAA51014.1 hypothetical protein BBO_00961 [Beauveria brongniartii RCEF 3172]PMB72033.1 hypothetical protein BM221_002133 [Beauveria bassiana]
MKFLAVVSSLVAVAAAAGRCGGDNCARQVTGTRDGLSAVTSRQNDCSSFMLTTIVPDATTTTVTVTVDPDEAPKSKRANNEVRAATEVPTAVPAYASGCDSASRYSSACACWGITASATTAAQPTKTVTVTVTSDYCEDL